MEPSNTGVPCPFVVGQRIHEVIYPGGYGVMELTDNGMEITSHIPMGGPFLDYTKPDATVIALTERGFAYRYDREVPVGPARWGSTTIEGECFSAGYQYWVAVGSGDSSS